MVVGGQLEVHGSHAGIIGFDYEANLGGLLLFINEGSLVISSDNLGELLKYLYSTEYILSQKGSVAELS